MGSFHVLHYDTCHSCSKKSHIRSNLTVQWVQLVYLVVRQVERRKVDDFWAAKWCNKRGVEFFWMAWRIILHWKGTKEKQECTNGAYAMSITMIKNFCEIFLTLVLFVTHSLFCLHEDEIIFILFWQKIEVCWEVVSARHSGGVDNKQCILFMSP